MQADDGVTDSARGEAPGTTQSSTEHDVNDPLRRPAASGGDLLALPSPVESGERTTSCGPDEMVIPPPPASCRTAPPSSSSAETLVDLLGALPDLSLQKPELLITTDPDTPARPGQGTDNQSMNVAQASRQQQTDVRSTSPDIPVTISQLEFTQDIIDKQYRSYVWNDGKMQTLVTIDAALIAGVLIALQTFKAVGPIPFALIGGAFFALVLSFIVCLVHAIPKLHSGVGNTTNLRTMVGIGTLTKEEYHEHVRRMAADDMLRMNCWQIAGMCRNNLRSYTLIRRGVMLTMSGVVALAVALPWIVYADWRRSSADALTPAVSRKLTTATTRTKIENIGSEKNATAPTRRHPPAGPPLERLPANTVK